MPTDTLETLRQVNRYLSLALVSLRPERKHSSSIKPEDFSAILGQLLRAAECPGLRKADGAANGTLNEEIGEYRRNLARLKQFLPDLQLRLLAERARLEAARTQLAAATAWASASTRDP